MLTGDEANAPRFRFALETLSHAPPELVLAATAIFSEPPPAFDTVKVFDCADDCSTNGKVNEVGFTARLGCPGAVAVNETIRVWVPGVAPAAVIVAVA